MSLNRWYNAVSKPTDLSTPAASPLGDVNGLASSSSSNSSSVQPSVTETAIALGERIVRVLTGSGGRPQAQVGTANELALAARRSFSRKDGVGDTFMSIVGDCIECLNSSRLRALNAPLTLESFLSHHPEGEEILQRGVEAKQHVQLAANATKMCAEVGGAAKSQVLAIVGDRLPVAAVAAAANCSKSSVKKARAKEHKRVQLLEVLEVAREVRVREKAVVWTIK